MMPGMNGIDLGISIRRIFPDCKVILLSGVAASSDLILLFALAPALGIAQPESGQRLDQVISRAFEPLVPQESGTTFPQRNRTEARERIIERGEAIRARYL